MTVAAQPLLETLRQHAGNPGLTRLLDHHSSERSWRRVLSSEDLELWLIAWPPGTSTGWHDHGSATGAFTVLGGTLVEYAWEGSTRRYDMGPGQARAFPASHIHDVHNASTRPALSLHAYSPRLETMTRYRVLDDRVQVLGATTEGDGW